MPYKRVNSRSIKLLGNATQEILISQGADRAKLNIGRDGDTEQPFSISAWIFIKDVADTAGIIAAISDRANGSPNQGKHQFLFQHQHPGQLGVVIFDCDGDSVKVDHDDNPATPVQYRFGPQASSEGLGARIRAETAQNVLTNNTWHFVTMTYDGSKTKQGLFLYVDAVDKTTTRTKSNEDGPGAPGAPKFIYTRMRDTEVPLILGSAVADFQQLPFENFMADVCIFNKALSPAEVSEVYNGGKVKDMTKSSTYNNLISWWKMGDDEDHEENLGIKDYVGDLHGTLISGPSIVASPELDTDLEKILENFTFARYGKTRQITNASGIYGNTIDTPAAAPTLATDGYPTENQRYAHLVVNSFPIDEDNNSSFLIYGYNNAFGRWGLLRRHASGFKNIFTQGQHASTQLLQHSQQTRPSARYVIEINGIDRIYIRKNTGNSTDQVFLGFNTF